jgi:hypothetical protein
MPFTSTSIAEGDFQCDDIGRPKVSYNIYHQMELWWWNPNTNSWQRLTSDSSAFLSTLACDGNLHDITCKHAAFTLPYYGDYFYKHYWQKSSGTWTGTNTATSESFIC